MKGKELFMRLNLMNKWINKSNNKILNRFKSNFKDTNLIFYLVQGLMFIFYLIQPFLIPSISTAFFSLCLSRLQLELN